MSYTSRAIAGAGALALVAAALYGWAGGWAGGWLGGPFPVATATPARATASLNVPVSEVDFGMAELDPGGRPVPIPSYKRGGPMVVFAGDELQFEALGDAPLPTLVLHAGSTVQVLAGASGRIRIDGPAHQALPAALLAQGTRRTSLPGGAPARVSVKVQVFGMARPAS